MVSRLFLWFENHRRDLPWRQEYSPYRVLVAEMMLAQTQVQRVIPYYLRFLERFPDVVGLASASREEVLLLWEGLGYYRRAHYLHEAAKVIVERFEGCVPDTLEALQSLPGVGLYIASAILGIGYNQPYLALDTNVRRVLLRVFGDVGVRKDLLALMPPLRARDLNEALMDFGALVCRARSPRCSCCPLKEWCVFPLGRGERSVTSEKPRIPLDIVIVVLRRGNEVLLKRSEGDLFPGLWGLPWEVTGEENLETLISEVSREWGLYPREFRVCGTIAHAYTKYRVLAKVIRVVGEEVSSCSPGVWVPEGALSRYPLASLFRKALVLECSGDVSGFSSKKEEVKEWRR